MSISMASAPPPPAESFIFFANLSRLDLAFFCDFDAFDAFPLLSSSELFSMFCSASCSSFFISSRLALFSMLSLSLANSCMSFLRSCISLFSSSCFFFASSLLMVLLSTCLLRSSCFFDSSSAFLPISSMRISRSSCFIISTIRSMSFSIRLLSCSACFS